MTPGGFGAKKRADGLDLSCAAQLCVKISVEKAKHAWQLEVVSLAISGWKSANAVARWEEDACMYFALSDGMLDSRDRCRAEMERSSCIKKL